MALWLQRGCAPAPLQGNVLHIAPESVLRCWLTQKCALYVGADLSRSDVDVLANLERLPFSEAAFTLVVCSHVLEHVEDDRSAMSELRRVLAPSGLCLVMVPEHERPTMDGDAGLTAEERRERFGQEDHLRLYGPDVSERLGDAGFAFDVVAVDRLLGHRERVRMGLGEATGRLYVCSPAGH